MTFAEAGPIVVLGSGQRCGSTLVQRLLSSHPDVVIWGEHRGQLRALFRALGELRVWDARVADVAREELREHGYQGFLANLMPGQDAIDDAGRAFVTELFGAPAQTLGRSRWGFKEVRYGRHACQSLHRLFPGARFIHITRDPRAVLSSLFWWERATGPWTRRDTRIALGFWLEINRSFLNSPDDGLQVLHVHYEDLVADPETQVEQLADFVGLEAKHLDLEVLATRVHTSGPRGRTERMLTPYEELPSPMRALIERKRFADVAAAWGYHL